MDMSIPKMQGARPLTVIIVAEFLKQAFFILLHIFSLPNVGFKVSALDVRKTRFYRSG